MKLEGKVAIVTGAATGIGAAIARRLATDGAAVTIADINDGTPVARELSSHGAQSLFIRADVSDERSVERMVAETVKRFGTVDILVNNAAIAAELELTPFEDQTLEQWRRILNVNTIGVFLCCESVSPIMRAKRSGRIINMTSSTAFKGAPLMLHYVASKGAVMAMTRSLARELGGDNILVNAVSPGYVLSEGNLANKDFLAAHRAAAIAGRAIPRDGYPDDIAKAVAFLAGSDSDFIAGQILAVDGGSVYH